MSVPIGTSMTNPFRSNGRYSVCPGGLGSGRARAPSQAERRTSSAKAPSVATAMDWRISCPPAPPSSPASPRSPCQDHGDRHRGALAGEHSGRPPWQAYPPHVRDSAPDASDAKRAYDAHGGAKRHAKEIGWSEENHPDVEVALENDTPRQATQVPARAGQPDAGRPLTSALLPKHVGRGSPSRAHGQRSEPGRTARGPDGSSPSSRALRLKTSSRTSSTSRHVSSFMNRPLSSVLASRPTRA